MDQSSHIEEPCEGASPVAEADVEAIEWAHAVGAGQPAKRAVVLLGAVAAGAIGLALFSFVGLAIGLCTVLFSTAELFLPYRYVLDGDGARSKIGFSASAIAWKDVIRVVVFDGGAKLSPVAEGSRLAPFRGIYLRFSGNEGQILGKIAALASHAVTVDRRTHPGGGNGLDPEAGV